MHIQPSLSFCLVLSHTSLLSLLNPFSYVSELHPAQQGVSCYHLYGWFWVNQLWHRCLAT